MKKVTEQSMLAHVITTFSVPHDYGVGLFHDHV